MSEPMKPRPLSHSVAVGAYVFHGDRVLLLKRRFPPPVWAPPGGRLQKGEEPVSGLLREVREETGLTVITTGPAQVWFGDWGEGPVLALDFLARAESDEVRLSDEHSEYRWATLEEIRREDPPVATHEAGYTIPDFEEAFRLRVWLDTRDSG